MEEINPKKEKITLDDNKEMKEQWLKAIKAINKMKKNGYSTFFNGPIDCPCPRCQQVKTYISRDEGIIMKLCLGCQEIAWDLGEKRYVLNLIEETITVVKRQEPFIVSAKQSGNWQTSCCHC